MTAEPPSLWHKISTTSYLKVSFALFEKPLNGIKDSLFYAPQNLSLVALVVPSPSSMSFFHGQQTIRVLEPALDPSTVNVNGRAVLLSILLLYGFGAAGYIVPTLCGVAQRGFFCDDDTIRYEFRHDTVTTVQLILYNLVLNAVTVIVTEYYRMNQIEKAIRVPKYKWRDSHLHVLFVRLVTYFGYSQIGFVMNLTLNVATKHMVGRLRPHFLDVCHLANDTCVIANQHKYIIDYSCTGNPEQVLDARKSFYSGHSCISMYCAVWSALYIQARLSGALQNNVVVPLLQTIMIITGLGISFSRITDNKHHWSDVLVGIAIGVFIAIYNCLFWTKIFSNNKEEEENAPLIISRQIPTTAVQLEIEHEDFNNLAPAPVRPTRSDASALTAVTILQDNSRHGSHSSD
ncbi:unnamed protein product [Caenorhabditis auriculariae]|uniref:Phosphatidic acid phosphatase type 2/haloperoxidase domain-containing protein n=1 Tax=Caenorhabditis auriculariae TaxID=2777116 RepID=A0A8S1HFF1_9PELO|nr:unnamed protein product [Caenorhabditis auriculariae]